MTRLSLTGVDLTLKALAEFESAHPQVQLADNACRKMKASVDTVRRVIATQRVCYGINTGFGALARQHIPRDQLIRLQYNLVRSHACGVGEALQAAITRRIMLLKANSLAIGNSGIRPLVVETLLTLLNREHTGCDLPAGYYAINHRAKPLFTNSFGNISLVFQAAAVTGVNSSVTVGYEQLALMSQVAASGAIGG